MRPGQGRGRVPRPPRRPVPGGIRGACDERLAWLTGFTGSAGFAAILHDKAGLFVDGRYRVQVRAQSDMGTFTPVDWPETKLEDWLTEALPRGGTVAYDPWLHTGAEVARLRRRWAAADRAPPVDNLVDRIWDRPARPAHGPRRAMVRDLAGLSATAKLKAVAGDLAEAGRMRPSSPSPTASAGS
jgi:Xaa-Pro aminopeptidase